MTSWLIPGRLLHRGLLVWTIRSYDLDCGFLSDHFRSHLLNAEHPPEESLVVLDVLGDGRVWVGGTRPGALQLVVLERAGQTLQSPSLTEINVHGRGEAHILLIIL